MTTVDIIDEIHRVRGLVTGIELLIDTDHRSYRFDPITDIFIVISEKLEKIEEVLKEL